MKRPGISVIIPSYNQGQYLRKAIESVLTQAYRPIEVLVVDGASTDESLAVLHSYDQDPCVRWVSEKDRGPVAAVNKGLHMACYEIGSITSADDFYLPGAFEECMAVFESHPKANLVYGDYRKGVETGMEIPIHTGSYSLGDLLSGMAAVPQGSAFFRTDVVRKLGGWDERIPFVPDTDLWLRMALTGNVTKVDRYWSGSRVHEGQRTNQRGNVLRDYTLMIGQMKELKSSAWRLQRAARAGLCLARMRYGSNLSDWVLAGNAWLALCLYPRCILSPMLPKHRLIPGYFRMAGWIGAVRRLVGLKTSTGRRPR
jgi:glycosyltransferase involved in cell wall biosynthesis